jgi:hypothetical protein
MTLPRLSGNHSSMIPTSRNPVPTIIDAKSRNKNDWLACRRVVTTVDMTTPRADPDKANSHSTAFSVR